MNLHRLQSVSDEAVQKVRCLTDGATHEFSRQGTGEHILRLRSLEEFVCDGETIRLRFETLRPVESA